METKDLWHVPEGTILECYRYLKKSSPEGHDFIYHGFFEKVDKDHLKILEFTKDHNGGDDDRGEIPLENFSPRLEWISHGLKQ